MPWPLRVPGLLSSVFFACYAVIQSSPSWLGARPAQSRCPIRRGGGRILDLRFSILDWGRRRFGRATRRAASTTALRSCGRSVGDGLEPGAVGRARLFSPTTAGYNPRMSTLLNQAIAKARLLPEPEQDSIAQLILTEMESEREWDRLIAGSVEKLGKAADAAWAGHEVGTSEELDPERL
jgi:hypothetical protein